MRCVTTLGVLLIGLFAMAGTAQAGDDQVKISEVFTGSAAHADAEFVEVQMYADGANLFAGDASLDFYGADGTVSGSADFGNPTGGNQRTVLATTTQGYTDLAMTTADALYGSADLLSAAGGAVCFHSATFLDVDCVSYGTFDNATASLPVGTNAPAPPVDQSLQRDITAHCPTQLEAADDTDSSVADFDVGAPTPTASSVTPALPVCTPPDDGSTPPDGKAPAPVGGAPPVTNPAKKKCSKGKKLKKGKCVKKKRKKKRKK